MPQQHPISRLLFANFSTFTPPPPFYFLAPSVFCPYFSYFALPPLVWIDSVLTKTWQIQIIRKNSIKIPRTYMNKQLLFKYALFCFYFHFKIRRNALLLCFRWSLLLELTLIIFFILWRDGFLLLLLRQPFHSSWIVSYSSLPFLYSLNEEKIVFHFIEKLHR